MPLRPSRPSERPAAALKVTPRRTWLSPYRACKSPTARSAVVIASMAVAEVGQLHRAVAADALGEIARDHLAVDHHRDPVGDPEYRVHVVLDEEDRVPFLEADEQVEHAPGLLGAHAGERLVE